MIATLLWVVVATVALVVALVLFAPLSLRAEGAAGDDELWGFVEFRWGRGLVVVRVSSEGPAAVSVLGFTVARAPALSRFGRYLRSKGESKKDEKTKPSRVGTVRRWVVDDRRVVTRMVARAVRAVHPELYVGGTVGLGDPADTAVMLAAVRRIEGLVAKSVALDVRDDYLEETTQLFARVSVWLVPAEVVWMLAVWGLRADTRGVLRGR